MTVTRREVYMPHMLVVKHTMYAAFYGKFHAM